MSAILLYDSVAVMREPTIELVAKAKAGDREAENELAARYLPRLKQWASGRLPRGQRSARDTGDLVQDAMFGALRNLKTFEMRHEGSFLFYLGRAVANQIRDLNRRPYARRVDMPADLPSPRPSPLDEAIGKERRERYDRALETLNEEDQTLVFLSFELGYTHAEVAQLTGKPSADAARMASKRAVNQLAAEMSKTGLT